MNMGKRNTTNKYYYLLYVTGSELSSPLGQDNISKVTEFSKMKMVSGIKTASAQMIALLEPNWEKVMSCDQAKL